jgi:uncharacterized membrane protein HdeD (DUF308 family)
MGDSEGSSLTLRLIRQVLLGGTTFLLGAWALAIALARPPSAPLLLGLTLLAGAALEALGAVTQASRAARRAMLLGAVVSAAAGILLATWGNLIFRVMAALLGMGWVIDGGGKLIAMAREPSEDAAVRKSGRIGLAVDGAVNLVIGLSIAVQWPVAGAWAVYLAVALRLLGGGWSILLGRSRQASLWKAAAPAQDADAHPDAHLGLEPHAALGRIRAETESAEAARWWTDTAWILTFLLTFFAIHIGRLDVEWDLVGFFSPGVAVAGDAFVALLIGYALIMPQWLAWRAMTRPVERWAWRRRLRREQAAESLLQRITSRWLNHRMRLTIRVQAAARSPLEAVRRGLCMGLPATAVLIGIVPLLGVSWYFNTESWATGAWERWAEHRVDDWREQMATAVRQTAADTPAERLFELTPPGVAGAGDFAFLVVGDPGEGDASQLVLKDRILDLGRDPAVKFLVVSSDVIYPQGAMKDYEAKFYLPFKGFDKPIYAIPGNHDWYDALEAFSANFFEPAAARASLLARREADHGLTSTTDRRIDAMLAEAEQLRRHYGVRSGAQHAPYFEVQTDRFALIAVDTGILKTVDAQQLRWLEQALQRAEGKFKFLLLGHPFYAGGAYAVEPGSSFAALHELLRRHDVELVMAGDTHDLEVYREPTPPRDGEPAGATLHMVNGGGGAYLSIGTALGWPAMPPVADCAFYPTREQIISKLDAQTPRWKWPLWWWASRLKAWPSTPETLAPAFASNTAPFFQSFVEVRVQPSSGVVRIRPQGVSGPLKWRDMQTLGQIIPDGQGPDDPVEFVLAMENPSPKTDKAGP